MPGMVILHTSGIRVYLPERMEGLAGQKNGQFCCNICHTKDNICESNSGGEVLEASRQARVEDCQGKLDQP